MWPVNFAFVRAFIIFAASYDNVTTRHEHQSTCLFSLHPARFGRMLQVCRVHPAGRNRLPCSGREIRLGLSWSIENEAAVRQGKRPGTLSVAADPNQLSHQPQEYERLEKKFKGLSPRQALYLILSGMGKDTREIAEVMGVSPEAVRSIRHRLKEKWSRHRHPSPRRDTAAWPVYGGCGMAFGCASDMRGS